MRRMRKGCTIYFSHRGLVGLSCTEVCKLRSVHIEIERNKGNSRKEMAND